ncbi:MAG: PAS domain-containing sensor histidine kinase, partial [Candidatus Helarchaeota archaeon]
DSEEKYRILVETAQEGIWRLDGELKTVFVNKAMAKMLGYTPNEMLNKPISAFMEEQWRKMLKQHLSTQEKVMNEPIQLQLLRKDGGLISTLTNASQLIDDYGNQVGAIAFVTDVTKHKIVQKNLLSSERKYRIITESANDLICVLNRFYRFEYINEHACLSLLGYSKDDLLGKKFTKINSPNEIDKVAELAMRSIVKGDRTLETKLVRKDGREVWVEIKGRRFIDGTRHKKILLVMRDISEKKALENAQENYLEDLKNEVRVKTRKLEKETEKLQKALDELKTTQRLLIESEKMASIGLLASGIAHEINNPLMGIINYANIIENELIRHNDIDLKKRPYSFLKEIYKEGKRISEIVSGLLSFSREDKGVLKYNEISEVIDSALLLIMPKLKRNQIEIEYKWQKNLPKIPMHEKKIQQVIMNVLQNSIDALNEKFGRRTKKHSKKIFLTTSLVTMEGTKHIKISVIDNGIGIEKEGLSKIFDPFFTTKSFSSEHGVGLGLSVSYGIIKSHGGEIRVESKRNEKTIVNIFLPLNAEKFQKMEAF